jgi:hypothetical protein
MKANFSFLYPGDHRDPDTVADAHAAWIGSHGEVISLPPEIHPVRAPDVPPGFENYYLVDVIGKEFVWLNKTFPKERFKWYCWYESVFLVPPEMATFLRLKWS